MSRALELVKVMKEAKETPSENCPNADEHEFKEYFHADGSEYYMWFYRCDHCKEVVVRKRSRTGRNKHIWAADKE